MSGILELRVNSPSVRLYPVAPPTISDDILAATAMTPGANSPSAPSICLLRGPLDDFIRYSREEASKWLIDLAHDICDPAERRGSLLVWKEPEQWHHVATTDPLTASIYRYDLPVGITVGLSKISERAWKSATAPIENARAMADRVKRRDGRCWVTAMVGPLANSHICPKRMGDHLARIIFRTFTSLPLPPNLSIYDDVFGLSLSLTLDSYFDEYEMGLHFVSPPNNYECHVFAIEQANVEYTIFGEIDSPACHPALHGHHASPPHPQRSNLPLPGLIRWHYLQCVIKRFAHDGYKNLENIYLPELPLRMKGDSDYEGTDSEAEWPSKGLDLGRVAEHDLEEREERHRAVESWISKAV